MCIDLKLDDVPTHPKKACMESWRLLRFFGENLGVWNDSGMCSWWIGMISLRKIAHHHKLGSCNPYKWSEINGFHWGQTNPTYRGPITPFIMIGSGLTSCMSRWGIEDLPRRQDVCKTNARTAKARVFWCEVGDRWNDMDTCWSYARLYLWYIIYTYIYMYIYMYAGYMYIYFGCVLLRICWIFPMPRAVVGQLDTKTLPDLQEQVTCCSSLNLWSEG